MAGLAAALATVPGWLGEPWPTSARRGADGELELGGVRARQLATEFGTPLYVLDEEDFRARARAFRAAFTQEFAKIGAEVALYYAGKALLTKTVARWARSEGLNIDAASGGELAVALAAGVAGEHLGLHGNNKSDAELTAAIDYGIGQVILDSLPEVERLAELATQRGARVPVLIRVTTGVHAGGHEYISTAHEDQKFGLSVAPPQSESPASPDLAVECRPPGAGSQPQAASPALQAALLVLGKPSLRLVGIHSHIGSQIMDTAGFCAAARAVLRLRAQIGQHAGVLVPEINLGGGYGIAYLPGEHSMDPRKVARDLAETVAATCQELATPVPRVAIEPGRCLIGPAGVSLYTVGTVKPVVVSDGVGALTRLYVAIDGGMSDNIRPALYGAKYHAELVSRSSTAPPVTARVVGKHCESGDILVRDVLLPADVAAGDLLALPATGAYGRSMANNYNLLPRPGVVSVAGGHARWLLRRETVSDLLALDVG